MPTTVAKRLTALEQAVADLSTKVNQPKDWRKAVGALRDSKLAREADELGRQFRTEQSTP